MAPLPLDGERTEDQQPTQSERARLQTLAQDKKLAAEAGKFRVKLRAAEAENQLLKSKIAELESRNGPPESRSGDTSPASEVSDAGDSSLTQSSAAVNSSVADDTSDVEEIDEDLRAALELRDELRANILHRDLSDAGVLFPAEVLAVLTSRKQLQITADGTPQLIIDSKPQPLSREGILKLVRPEFLRAEGIPGMGSRTSSRPAEPGIDMSKATDPRYYRAHRAQIIAELKKGR